VKVKVAPWEKIRPTPVRHGPPRFPARCRAEPRSSHVRSPGSPIAIEDVREIFRSDPAPGVAIVTREHAVARRARRVTVPPSG
jgi:hypothetical protein